jgi:hypothetical protein
MSIKKTTDASQWIKQHNPDRRERRFLARAIVASNGRGSAAESKTYCVIRRGQRFTFEGPHSTLTTTGREGLDKIMAAIAWADAFEEELNDRQGSEHG